MTITDEMVERAARAVEKARTAKGYGWTDEQFEIWWNHDEWFIAHKKTWAHFTGTQKEKVLHETRIALEAAFDMKEKKFTVEGYDSFDNQTFPVGKYATKEDAIDVANAKGGQMTIMYVLDEKRNILYRAGSF